MRANIEWDVPIILAANKVDCDHWELTESEIKSYSQKKAFPIYLTSAKIDQNVAAAFNRLATEITGIIVKLDSPD